MEHDLYGRQKRIWNILRNRKKSVKEYIQISKIMTEEWEKYFEQLYSNKEKNMKTKETPTNEETPPTWQIPIEKIKQTANALKNINQYTVQLIKIKYLFIELLSPSKNEKNILIYFCSFSTGLICFILS